MRVLIAAGGTAGHINPALAIAGALKKADPTAEIHFAGRKEGMEYRLVTQAGYPFHHIEITGFQRKLSLHNIKRNIVTLWNLALSGPKAKAIMKEVQPDLVIGCGGYVSGPVVRCAAKMGIHTALHEQNAFPGVTNKLLAPDVDIVFAAVPAAVEKLGAPQKTIVVGNPVRRRCSSRQRTATPSAQLGQGTARSSVPSGWQPGCAGSNEVVGDCAPGSSTSTSRCCICTPPASTVCSCSRTWNSRRALLRATACGEGIHQQHAGAAGSSRPGHQPCRCPDAG